MDDRMTTIGDMAQTVVAQSLAEHLEVARALEALRSDIARAGEMAGEALLAGGKLLFCGNGGSAADAQHLAAEFTGRFLKERRPLPALALHTNSSGLTAIGNDYGFDQVFARQVEAFGRPGDLLIGLLRRLQGGRGGRLFPPPPL